MYRPKRTHFILGQYKKWKNAIFIEKFRLGSDTIIYSMRKSFLFLLFLAFCNLSLAQNKDGYYISQLKKLPVIVGCEEVQDSREASAECMATQFEAMFIPYIKDLPSKVKSDRVEIYIEFVITQEGKITLPKRVTVSEKQLHDYIANAFKMFRRDFLMNKTELQPGLNRNDQKVNTIFGIKLKKRFRR